MYDGRSGHLSVLLNDGRVMVIGGSGDLQILASAEIYDPATGEWVQAGEMSTERLLHAATTLMDGRVLVTGGFDLESPIAIAEIYDP